MRRGGKSSKSSYDRSQGNQEGDGPRDVITQQEGENQEKEG